MKRLLVASAAFAALTGVALAQSTTTPSTTAPMTPGASSTTTTTTTTITPAQETAVKTYVMKEKTSAVSLPSGTTLSEGAVLPQTVTLSKFDNSVTGMSTYNYVVVDGRTAIVEPSSRRVVKIIETK